MSNEALKELCQQKDFKKYLANERFYRINLVTLICIQGLAAPLKELVSRAPNDFKSMIEEDNYSAFQWAAAKGHLPILQYLAEQAPEKLQAMIEEYDYFVFRWAARDKHYAAAYFIREKARGISKELFNPLIKQLTAEQKEVLSTLCYESSMIHHALFKDNLFPKELIECIEVSAHLFPFFKPARECLGSKNMNQTDLRV